MAEFRERFRTPAEALNLSALLRKNRKILYIGVVIGVVAHAVLATYFVLSKPERTVVRPPTVQFVIRKPRMTKAFEFKKKKPPKRMMARKVVTAKPKLVKALSKSTMGADLIGTIPMFDYSVGESADVGLGVVEPQIAASEIVSSKEPERRISMQEEFLDLQALDTGKYKAMVIQDPSDKQNIKGFVYLATAWGNDLSPSAQRAVPELVQAIGRYTSIEAKVDNHLFLDSRDMFRAPIVYINTNKMFILTEKEIENLGEYMKSGGFILAENARPDLESGPAEVALRKLFDYALGRQARWVRLSSDHPIYHAFFDFDDGPPPGKGIGQVIQIKTNLKQVDVQYRTKPRPYLEGIYLGDRLVGVYSDKNYGAFWQQGYENEPQLKMGVNIVVYALTQPGSIAQQQIDFYSYGH